MKRRRFIVGTATAAIGGSALLGSGAFSRVESHREVTIEVVGDEDAYLRLVYGKDLTIDDCVGELEIEVTNQLKADVDSVEFEIFGDDLSVVDPTVPDSIGLGETEIITVTIECEEDISEKIGFEIEVDGEDLSVEAHRATGDDRIQVDCNCPTFEGPTISWVTFCGSDLHPEDIEFSNFVTDADGGLGKVDWEYNGDGTVETVVVKAGQPIYNIEVDGDSSGTIEQDADGEYGEETDDEQQPPNEPCPDGQCGPKFEWDDDAEEFDDDGHQDDCE